MKNKWHIVNYIFSLLIVIVGVVGIFYVNNQVPEQLELSSTLLTSGENEGDAPVQDTPKGLSDVIDESQTRVVKIETKTGSIGSGFLYNDKGDIITNAHVVAGVKEVTVITATGERLDGTVIGISESTDVALVRVEELTEMEPMILSLDVPEIGDDVLAIGSPFGFENTVTTGIISGVNRNFEIPPYNFENVYQITAQIAPGNSGGPLVNLKTGEVVGINSAVIEQTSIGFSIPITNVIGLLQLWSNTPMMVLPNIDDSEFPYNGIDGDGDSAKDMAVFLINLFYENINFHDYITAYSFLGRAMQVSTPYEEFRGKYLSTDWVTVEDIWLEEEGSRGDTHTVMGTISTQERVDGRSTLKKYEVTYTVGFENDQLKIITMEEEEIE
ncbi:MAG: S1C family serine protease [Bacillus sp. (in: Bacteria)]|nr:S1C family serine protease [Bacillus sp. (in: firmicutes)]